MNAPTTSKLRIIYTDTMTSEPMWVDVLELVPFTAESVVKAVMSSMGADETDAQPIDRLELKAWILDGYGSTAVFVFAIGKDLVHGVCHTRFNPDYQPQL